MASHHIIIIQIYKKLSSPYDGWADSEQSFLPQNENFIP